MTELELRVPFSGIDPRGNVKFGVLLEMFQEMADADAFKYGLSVRQTLDKDVTWVLRSYRVNIKRYPDKRDGALRIKTWHEPYRGLFSLRTFEFCAPSGEELGTASTWWVLLDLNKMRPMRLDRSDIYSYSSESTLKETPPEVKVPRAENPGIEELWKVRWQDLDVNGHTNHAVYFGWVLDAVPPEVPAEMLPMLVEGEFLRPLPRTEVRVSTAEAAPSSGRAFAHSLQTPRGDSEYARFFSHWR